MHLHQKVSHTQGHRRGLLWLQFNSFTLFFKLMSSFNIIFLFFFNFFKLGHSLELRLRYEWCLSRRRCGRIGVGLLIHFLVFHFLFPFLWTRTSSCSRKSFIIWLWTNAVHCASRKAEVWNYNWWISLCSLGVKSIFFE